MKIQLLRHSTLLIEILHKKLLVDPMLAAAGAADPIANTPNQRRNPLVDLPMGDNALLEIIQSLDGVLVTHTHRDHWDPRAQELLPKKLPVFCQPEDRAKIDGVGFHSVQQVINSQVWDGIEIIRTDGQHGTGKMAELMAPVSGFVLKAQGEPTLYIAGDTIWCKQVEQVIEEHQPAVIVVNAGAAQFNTGGPITMTAGDVIQVANQLLDSQVIAVHLEAINHCILSRAELKQAVVKAQLNYRVHIPADGAYWNSAKRAIKGD